MFGNIGTHFAGFVRQQNDDNLLFEHNIARKYPVETNVGTSDLSGQTINIGYSILSDAPDKINEAIKSGKCIIKKVLLTNYSDCTLRGELHPAVADVPEHIDFWKTSDNLLPFRKVIYAGINENEIANNFQLWNSQLATMEAIIKRWASNSCYSGSFASASVSLDMKSYDIVLSDSSSDGSMRYKVNNCEELLRVLKSESSLPLVNIPKYEAANCLQLPWNSFNKRTVLDLMTSVNGIINSPKAVPRNGENYISTLPLQAEVVPGEFAYTCYETMNTRASNYVRIMNNAFIDAFEPIDGIPTLLQLEFSTDFYFELKPEHDPENDECHHSQLHNHNHYHHLHNPDIMVSAPLESSAV